MIFVELVRNTNLCAVEGAVYLTNVLKEFHDRTLWYGYNMNYILT